MYNRNMRKFKIDEKIEKALSVMQYVTYTEVQEKVIPLLLDKKNCIVKAKTGSGKSASYGIPICENVDWDKNEIQALILTCTRELVMQVNEEIKEIGRFKKIRSVPICGKMNMDHQIQELKQKTHIVVATPGRLLDHLENKTLDLCNVSYVIIDEADRMLDMGFLPQVEEILKYLNKNYTIALFSATYEDKMKKFASSYIKDASFIEIKEKTKIKHYYIETNDKEATLIQYLNQNHIQNTIVFANTKAEVEKVYRQFIKKGIRCVRIHGDIDQKNRFKYLEMFKTKEVKILVASDVAARGIDVAHVSHVIHYEIAHTKEDYIHRSGRSGRMNEEGISVTFVESKEELKSLIEDFKMEKEVLDYDKEIHLEYLNQSQKIDVKKEKWEKHSTKIYINVGKEKKIRVNDIVGALCSLDGITQEDIGVIEVLGKMTYVEIFNEKASQVCLLLNGKTIKKKKVIVEIAK